jgi:hypothetical protein
MKTNILNVLSSLNGNTFMGITTRTIVALPKKNSLHNRLEKITEGSIVQCFQNKHVNGYGNMIKRRLESEGKDANFTVGARVWGERLPELPIVQHKNQQYLEVIFVRAGKTSYLLDGNSVPFEQIAEYLPEKKEGNQGGLSDDSKVIIRTFAMDSLTSIRIGGKEYVGEFYYAE